MFHAEVSIYFCLFTVKNGCEIENIYISSPPSNHNKPFSLEVNESRDPVRHICWCVDEKSVSMTLATFLYLETSGQTTSRERQHLSAILERFFKV